MHNKHKQVHTDCTYIHTYILYSSVLLCTYMNACIYMLHTTTGVHACTRVQICACVYICACMYARVHMCMHACMLHDLYMRVCVSRYVYDTYMKKCTLRIICMQVHVCTHLCVFIRIFLCFESLYMVVSMHIYTRKCNMCATHTYTYPVSTHAHTCMHAYHIFYARMDSVYVCVYTCMYMTSVSHFPYLFCIFFTHTYGVCLCVYTYRHIYMSTYTHTYIIIMTIITRQLSHKARVKANNYKSFFCAISIITSQKKSACTRIPRITRTHTFCVCLGFVSDALAITLQANSSLVSMSVTWVEKKHSSHGELWEISAVCTMECVCDHVVCLVDVVVSATGALCMLASLAVCWYQCLVKMNLERHHKTRGRQRPLFSCVAIPVLVRTLAVCPCERDRTCEP